MDTTFSHHERIATPHRCNFVTIPANPNLILYNNATDSWFKPSWLYSLPELEFGIFSRGSVDYANLTYQGESFFFFSEGQCQTYTSLRNADGLWLASMILVIISWAVALILSFALIISSCCAFSNAGYYTIGTLFIVICGACQGLIFLSLNSTLCSNNPDLPSFPELEKLLEGQNPYNLPLYADFCAISTGAILCIISTCGYVITGLTCFCLRKQQPPVVAQEEETKAAVAADGAAQDAAEGEPTNEDEDGADEGGEEQGDEENEQQEQEEQEDVEAAEGGEEEPVAKDETDEKKDDVGASQSSTAKSEEQNLGGSGTNATSSATTAP